MRLKEKVAVVTGGSQGIGAAICRRYAEEGGRGRLGILAAPDVGMRPSLHSRRQSSSNGFASPLICGASFPPGARDADAPRLVEGR